MSRLGYKNQTKLHTCVCEPSALDLVGTEISRLKEEIAGLLMGLVT